jgi:hypothetical protein
MLPFVANHKDAVGCPKTMDKFVYLSRACKTRFIDNEKSFLTVAGRLVANELPRRIAWQNASLATF